MRKNRTKYLKQWRKNHRKHNTLYMREYRKKLKQTKEGIETLRKWRGAVTLNRRIKVFEQYGGCKCVLCGIDDIYVLVLDHINGGGTKERKKPGRAGNFTYQWVIKNNFPKGFRVLCHNCNWKEHLRKDFGYSI